MDNSRISLNISCVRIDATFIIISTQTACQPTSPVLSHMVHSLRSHVRSSSIPRPSSTSWVTSSPIPLACPARLYARLRLCIDARNNANPFKTPKCGGVIDVVFYTITSPQSTRFGRHLLVSNSPSMLLGTVTSIGR
jgi:hypothetical protein